MSISAVFAQGSIWDAFEIHKERPYKLRPEHRRAVLLKSHGQVATLQVALIFECLADHDEIDDAIVGIKVPL